MYLFNSFRVIGKSHSAAGGSYNFISVKGQRAYLAECSAFFSFIGCAESFGSVFKNRNIVFFANRNDFFVVCAVAVKINNNNRFRQLAHCIILFKGNFQRIGIHVEALVIGINENKLGSEVSNRIAASRKGEVRTENNIAASHSEILQAHVYCAGTRSKRNAVLCSDIFTHFFFKPRQIRSERGNPVCLKGLVDKFNLRSVHARWGKINSFVHLTHFFSEIYSLSILFPFSGSLFCGVFP